MKELIFVIAAILAIASLVLAQISGIGYALYEWASGLTLAAAAWSGFKVWMLMMVSALLNGSVALYLRDRV